MILLADLCVTYKLLYDLFDFGCCSAGERIRWAMMFGLIGRVYGPGRNHVVELRF